MSTSDDVIPGNFGLWDQKLALEWVQNYIQDFGGDPKKVSISTNEYALMWTGQVIQGKNQSLVKFSGRELKFVSNVV